MLGGYSEKNDRRNVAWEQTAPLVYKIPAHCLECFVVGRHRRRTRATAVASLAVGLVRDPAVAEPPRQHLVRASAIHDALGLLTGAMPLSLLDLGLASIIRCIAAHWLACMAPRRDCCLLSQIRQCLRTQTLLISFRGLNIAVFVIWEFHV